MGIPTIVSWTEAVAHIEEINLKSGTQWRLPTIDELASLGISGCGNPSINVNVFPNAMVENYWASNKSPHTLDFAAGCTPFREQRHADSLTILRGLSLWSGDPK